MALTDLSGRPLPTRNDASQVPRVLAIPPVRDVPNHNAQEFLASLYSSLAPASFGTQLVDPTAFSLTTVPDSYVGRIDWINVYCGDMVAAAGPYLRFHLMLSTVPANAWGNVPVYPRVGTANLTFPTVIDLPASTVIKITGDNLDASNSHSLLVRVHGWLWPRDVVEG